MPQVAVTIAGRVYRMACDEGEEEHLSDLARTLDGRIGALRGQFGEIGDQRITVMAAITLADDLSDAHKRVASLEATVADLTKDCALLEGRIEGMTTAVVQALDQASTGMDDIARMLDGEAS